MALTTRDYDKESMPVYKLVDVLIKYEAPAHTIWINDDGGLSIFDGSVATGKLKAIINLEKERVTEV